MVYTAANQYKLGNNKIHFNLYFAYIFKEESEQLTLFW